MRRGVQGRMLTRVCQPMMRAGSLVVVLLAMMAWPQGAGAQSASPRSAVEFVPNTRFYMDAEHISHDDIRFQWDANFFGEIDVLGWKGGRATFTANYEVVLGNQLRRFDPNQGNYLLEGTVTQRVRGIDLSGQFHHISRHLADRPKVPAVDWNQLGVRIGKQGTRGKLDVQAYVDLRTTVANSFVDYAREAEGDLRLRYAIRPKVALLSNTRLRVIGTDGTGDRGTQTGFRTEGGVHLTGSGGAIELFLAAERRVDPYPTQFSTARWVTAGFRLLAR